MRGRLYSIRIVNVVVFIVLEAAAIAMLYNSSIVQRSWLAQGATVVKAAVWEKAFGLKALFSMKEENAALERERIVLMNELEKALTSQSAGEPYREEYKNFKLIPADIVTMSPGGQHNYLIINKGQADGIQENDGIITPFGAVGVVKTVSKNFSYAISYANAQMVISTRVGREGSVGAMSWTGRHSKKSHLSGVPIHANAEVGDTVYTSGFSSIFPPDIPLGIIAKRKISGGSSAEFDVDLFEDYFTLRHVAVAQNKDRKEIEQLKNDAK